MKVELVAVSRADDLSYRSLADAIAVTDGVNARVVGGHMVSLLLTAFPVHGVLERRTRDSDVAVETQIAAEGVLHAELTARGYTGRRGNQYERDDDVGPPRQIDLLIPSPDSSFRRQELGGRGFDSAPGLLLALNAAPIVLECGASLLDGSRLEFTARVPSVEVALVLKSITYDQRAESRDLQDLIALLEIAAQHPHDRIGGWALDSSGLTATRAQAAAILRRLRDARRLPNVPGAPRLPALVAGLIAPA